MNLNPNTVYDTAARKWIPRTPAIEAAMRGTAAPSDTTKRFVTLGASVETPPAPPNVFERFFLAEVAQKTRAGIVPAETPKVPTPTVPHVSDHVGHALDAYSVEGREEHKLAIAYMERANLQGKTPSYLEALLAVTRKRSTT